MGPTPEQVAAADQSAKWLVDYYAAMWSGIFKRLVDDGMTRAEALVVLTTYIHANPTSPRREEGPDEGR